VARKLEDKRPGDGLDDSALDDWSDGWSDPAVAPRLMTGGLPFIVQRGPGAYDVCLGWAVIRVVESGLSASVLLHLADGGADIPISRCDCAGCKRALN
jgi:hypothetical protein